MTIPLASAAAFADVSFRIESSAPTAQERNAEKRELKKELDGLLKSTEFLRIVELVKGRCGETNIVIVIRFGDSGEHTQTSDAGGTFVPKWKNPDNPVGQRGFDGGTLIVDKARLAVLRPDHPPSTFFSEVIAHELWHAYEDCIDRNFHSEDDARRWGERVAEQLGFRTLDGTRPSSGTPPSSEAPPSSGTSSEQSSAPIETPPGAAGAGYYAGTVQNGCLAAYAANNGSAFQPSCLHVSFGVAGSLVDSGAVFGTGTIVNLGGEHFAARVPDQISRFGLDLEGKYRLPGPGLLLEDGARYLIGGFSYAGGEASDRGGATVDVDGVTTIGLTFLEPDGAVTGASTSTAGNFIEASANASNSWVRAHFGYAEAFRPWGPDGARVQVGAAAVIEDFQTSYSAWAEIFDPAATSLATQETTGESDNRYYGVELSGKISYPLTSRLSVGVSGYLTPAYRTSDASISQFTSVGSVSQDLRDESSGFALSGGVGAHVSYEISDRLRLKFSYEYSCLAGVTELNVPANPDEQPAYFNDTRVSRNFWGAELDLQF